MMLLSAVLVTVCLAQVDAFSLRSRSSVRNGALKMSDAEALVCPKIQIPLVFVDTILTYSLVSLLCLYLSIHLFIFLLSKRRMLVRPSVLLPRLKMSELLVWLTIVILESWLTSMLERPPPPRESCTTPV